MLLRMVAHTLAFGVVLGLLLFLPGGTLAWPQAWGFIVLFTGCSEALGLWLSRYDPGLLAARKKSPFGAQQKIGDRVVIAVMSLLFAGWFVFMALDARRFGWSHTTLWAQLLGAGLIIVAFLGWVGVLKANSFAAVTLELQPERGQTVISSGPYAVVRHPMYSYTLLLMIGVPLLLGSLWGLLGLLAILPLLVARLRSEEAMLRDGLPGYHEYVARVRFRLVPGLW